MAELLSLKWNNHTSVFFNLLQNLQSQEVFCDTTIICDTKFFPAHKFVLSTCSEYFEVIYKKMSCKHPFIIVNDVEPSTFELLLNYMYRGEVNVCQNSLSSLIKAAEALKIRGLAIPDDVESAEPPSRRERKRKSVTSQNYISKFRRSSTELIEDEELERNTHLDSSTKDVQEENLESATGCIADTQVTIKSEPEDIKIFSDGYSENHVSESAMTEPKSKDDRPSFFPSSVKGFQENERFAFSDPEGNEDLMLHPFHLTTDVDDQQSNNWPNSSGNFKHNCSFCSYGSYSRSAVSKHEMRIHTGVRPYKCDLCSYSATTQGCLRIHVRKHTGEKPFRCQVCSYRSSCHANLRKHQLTHHLPV